MVSFDKFLAWSFWTALTLFVIGLNVSISLKELSEALMILTALMTLGRIKDWPKFDRKFLIVLFLWVLGAFVSYYLFAPIEIPVERTELPNFRWIFFFFAFVILSKFYLDWNLLAKIFATVFATSFVADLVLFFQTGGRASGLIYHPVNFANIIAPFVLISWVFVLHGFAQKKYDVWFGVHAFCVVVGSFLVLATQTRGVIIAFLPLMMILSWFFRWRAVLLAFGLVLCCVAAAFVVSDNLTERMRNALEAGKTDYSRTTRFAFWKANYEIWQEHPIFGVGYGVNNFLYYDKLDESARALIDMDPGLKVVHAHNQFLQILAGGGVWGLFFFLALLGTAYRGLRYCYRAVTDPLSRVWVLGLTSAFTCFLIAGCTEANFSVTKNRYIFVLLFACIVSLYQNVRRQAAQEDHS